MVGEQHIDERLVEAVAVGEEGEAVGLEVAVEAAGGRDAALVEGARVQPAQHGVVDETRVIDEHVVGVHLRRRLLARHVGGDEGEHVRVRDGEVGVA